MPPTRALAVPGLLQVGIEVATVPAPTYPLAVDFMALWQARRQTGQAFTRADVPCRDLLRFMPNLILFEPLDDGADWHFRLVGSAIRQRFGIEPTGLTVRGLYTPADAEVQAGLYRWLARESEPSITRGRVLGLDRDYLDVEFCNMPLPARDPGQPWLLTGVFPPP
ncbi:PAS domain-containing protein [Zavarzinia sp. CC-PAN008]|uniref:PAS domain-containing protein n=1 Tax=Zavarzinia sp. CC-PAN008 TaxID=3243332 RepID=UPI003F743B14